ncbi:MAG: hypothetical protein ACRDN9_08395 [Streptosporangiaceae bacterium]
MADRFTVRKRRCTADQAARTMVDMALTSQDGPTGQFVDQKGTVPW